MGNSQLTLRLALLAIAFGFFCACKPASEVSSSSPSSSSSSSGSSSSSSSTTTALTVNQPLYFTLQGFWANSTFSSFTDQTCFIPTGTTLGAAPVLCNVAVPETTLHYSDILFTVGSNSSTTCSVIKFQPYYYQRSSAAAYTPPGTATPITCNGSTLPLPIGCYGGAAPVLYSTFPNPSYSYQLPLVAQFQTYTIKASETVGATNTDYTILGSNVMISDALVGDPLTVGTWTNAQSFSQVAPPNTSPPTYSSYVNGVDYVAKSGVYYTVTCQDPYANPLYTLYLKILSVPTNAAAPAYDNGYIQYFDWNYYPGTY